jgi:MFS family permease
MNATSEAKPTLKDDLGALLRGPRDLWLIYLATFFEYLGIFSFLPTVTLWLSNDFSLDDKAAGSWAALFSIMITAVLVLVGIFVDRIGVRRMLLLSFMLAAITRLGMSLATTATLALATMMSFAFAYGSISPSLQVAVGQAATKRTRPFAYSLWYVSFNLAGAIVGPVTDAVRKAFVDPSGIPGDKAKLIRKLVHLPLVGDKSMSAYSAIMGLGFVFALLAAVTTLLVRKDFAERAKAFERSDNLAKGRPAIEEEAASPKKVNPFTALKEVVGDQFFWRFMALIGFVCLVKMMFQHMHFTWPKYVLREQGEQFPVGTLWSVKSLLILGLAPLGTALTRNRGVFETLLLGTFISALSPVILCFGSSMPFQIAMILTLTVGEALWSPRHYEYTISIAPKGRESLYVSLAALPFFAAKFIVGPTSGFLLQNFCPETGARKPAVLWGIIALSTLIGPLGMWLLRGWIQEAKSAPENPEATS